MDNDIGFDIGSQALGHFFEEQNAFDAAQPDLSCELFPPEFMSLFYTQSTVNCHWSQPPNEIDISSEDSTPLDSKTCISRPNTQDEITAYTQDWTDECSKWSMIRTAWSLGRTMSGKTPSQRPVCHYPGCTSAPFRTTYDLKMHLKYHLHEILSGWIGGHTQPCKWPDCPSKATFKSKKALQTHLENIHVDPLLCPEKDCPYRSPFRNNYDLKRHVKTIHYGEKELQFQCPFPQCGDYPRTFVRKDKWLNHLRSGHDDSACPLNHCEAGATGMQAKLVEHIKIFHGNFECGIGSCHQQPSSRFAKFELLKHLEFYHGIQHGDIDIAQNAANQASDRTVRSKDLPRETIWRDCRLCLGRSGIQEKEKEMNTVICLD